MATTAVKLAYSIEEALAASGFGRTTLYELIKQGRLESRKLGKKTLIPAESLRALIAGLPRGVDAPPTTKSAA